jgi:hypothetical protein
MGSQLCQEKITFKITIKITKKIIIQKITTKILQNNINGLIFLIITFLGGQNA